MEPLTCHQPGCEVRAAYLAVTDGARGDTSFLIAEALCQPHHWARHAEARSERDSYRVRRLPPTLIDFVPQLYVNGEPLAYDTLQSLTLASPE